jgi:hypothetical protein
MLGRAEVLDPTFFLRGFCQPDEADAVGDRKGGEQFFGHQLATGPDVLAVETELKSAIRFHLDGLREDGLPSPEPETIAEYLEA